MDWQEVAIDGEKQLKRMLDMYKELGFEIRLEEVQPDAVEHCTECLQQTGEKLFRVLVRREQEVGE